MYSVGDVQVKVESFQKQMFNSDHVLNLIRIGAYQVPHLPHKWNINDARCLHSRSSTHMKKLYLTTKNEESYNINKIMIFIDWIKFAVKCFNIATLKRSTF